MCKKYDDNTVYSNLIWTQNGGNLCNRNKYAEDANANFEGSRIYDDFYHRGKRDKKIGRMQLRYIATKESMKNPDYSVNVVDLDGKITQNKEKFKEIESENFKILEKNQKKSWW